MNKLTRVASGFYDYEKPNGDILHFYKIDRKTWGYSINGGMTQDTASTLGKLREKYIYDYEEIGRILMNLEK